MLKPTSKPSLSRDFVLLSLVILFFLSLAAVLVTLRAYEEHSKTTIDHLRNESLRIDQALIVEIENTSYLLESLARQISQIGPDDLNGIARLLRSFNDQAHREDVFSWIDVSQTVVVSSNRGILSKPVDVSDRDYIKKALAEPWRIQIGRPIQGRVSEKWVVPICLGLTDYRGNHVGAILASLDINTLTIGLRKVIRETGVDFSVYSTTLNPLTEPMTNTIFTPDDQVQQRLARVDFKERPNGILSQASLLHPHLAYSFYGLSSQFPYVIMVSYDPEVSARQINSTLLGKLLQIAGIACVLMILLWVIRTRIIRPVEQLGDIVADIARGKKYRPLARSGPLEIEQLAGQIKKIDEYLEERRRKETELVQKNRFLLQVKDTAQRMAKARLEFLHTLSAELLRPVQIIEEEVQAIKDQHFGPLGNARYAEQAEGIHLKSRLLRQMIDDLGAITELEYGALVINEVPVDVSFAIHRAMRQFTEMPHYKHIDVKLRLDEELPKLVIDEDKLNQILLHMLSSAVLRAVGGSSFIVETMIDRNQQGEEDFIIMLKYTQAAETLDEHARIPGAVADQIGALRSDGINMALTRMLLSLHQGRLEVSVSHNQVCRIFLRFPASRIHHGEGARKAV